MLLDFAPVTYKVALCQCLEKTDDTIPRKCPDRCKDGETLFHRTLLANASGPIIKNGRQILYNRTFKSFRFKYKIY